MFRGKDSIKYVLELIFIGHAISGGVKSHLILKNTVLSEIVHYQTFSSIWHSIHITSVNMSKKQAVYDLRSALKLLRGIKGEFVETNEPVDPMAELSGVYRYVGAHGTTMRPTKIGPAMLFNKVKGYKDVRVAIGVLGSRKRVGELLGAEPKHLGKLFHEAVATPIPPKVIDSSSGHIQAQEVVHLATEPDFDILKILPAPTNTVEDAGPYFTMGLVYAKDPENGQHDVTIHRLCVQGKDILSIYMLPGSRHIGVFQKKAEAAGKPLPITISIGVDPAVYMGTSFEPPTTPLGYDELCVAGSIRKKPVELVKSVSVDGLGIANAEVIIEGEILPNATMHEDAHTKLGVSMPEFPGYQGKEFPAVKIVKVKAITHRKSPILQTCIGTSSEVLSMAGIPTEASILMMVEKALPGFVLNVHNPAPGNGKLVSIIQVKKRAPVDEGRQIQAALLAFASFSELKHVILVDEDVDIFDMEDVMWAMTTRFQGDQSIHTIKGVRCHPLDPSQDPEYSSSIRDYGISCKTIFDCTVPYKMKDKFRRSPFKEVDVTRFIPGFKN